MTSDFKIVMLVSDGDSSKIMYHALKDTFVIEKVIVEESVSKKRLILNRIKRLGYLKVFGQILFMLFNKILIRFSNDRIQMIKRLNHLQTHAIEDEKMIQVHSVNDFEVIEMLKKINPDAVVVNGTRIISHNVINAIKAPFINTHVGITPKYRGVHGGYWALANEDKEHCGVTVHLVDNGIDTGDVIFQETISVTKQDNFNTYPILQLAKAIPLMKKAIKNVEEGSLKTMKVTLPSMLWYHPTLWGYLLTYLRKGVK